MLAVYPSDQLRVTIAIYTLSRAAEFAYNLAEDEGWIWGKTERPWWWGSWLIFPVTCGQLLHAFVFDRDCFPKVCIVGENWKVGHGLWCEQEYGDFIIKHSPAYVHPRPDDYPPNLSWPGTYEMVDSLAQMAKLNYP